MTHYSNLQSQRGSIAFNVIMILMLIVIGVLIYILASGDVSRVGTTGGVDGAPTTNDVTSGDGTFVDGLTLPTSVENFPLDEFGAGLSNVSVFTYDINNDGRPDRITRSRIENGTSHYYDEYKIELNTPDGYQDITPDGFRTVEGTECALSKLKFTFRPDFYVVKIARNWQDSWVTPTMAHETVYRIVGDKLVATESKPLRVVCDVVGLF